MKLWIAVLMVLGLGMEAYGASPFKHSLTVKKGEYLEDGVFIGGKAGTGTSLLNVRRSFSSKAKTERIIVDLGDKEGKPLGRSMSYFQVSMDSKDKRIVVDLSQLMLSKVSEAQLRRTFAKSPFVSKVDLTLDPEDKAATLVLGLKRPMKLEVFQLLKARKPGRIVMDLRPTQASNKLPAKAKTKSRKKS